MKTVTFQAKISTSADQQARSRLISYCVSHGLNIHEHDEDDGNANFTIEANGQLSAAAMLETEMYLRQLQAELR